MRKFKEWLSDYLRYFLLLFAAILAVLLITAGIRIYQETRKGNSDQVIQILSGEQTEKLSEEQAQEETEKLSEEQTQEETEKLTEEPTEKQTEGSTEDVTEKVTAGSGTSSGLPGTVSGGQTAAGEGGLTETGADNVQGNDAEAQGQNRASQTQAAAPESGTERATEAERMTETETAAETEYTPVYKTLQGSCYIRSAPSMEAEIIGEYMYGTTVEFLEDVGGWYKVQIDGMVGYMGARFF